MEPRISDAPVIVYVDVKSPYAYLAIAPTRALERELGLAFEWRPLTLDIPSYLGSARADKRGRVLESRRSPAQWHAVRYAYRDAKRYARARGLELRGTQKIWDSSIAAIGFLYAKAQGRAVLDAYVDRVFERFWKHELDIEDAAVVEAALAEASADTAGFAAYLAGPGREAHDALQAALHPAGIFGVPSYVVGDELFFGREHLPAVRWLLTGARGPAPDPAYV